MRRTWCGAKAKERKKYPQASGICPELTLHPLTVVDLRLMRALKITLVLILVVGCAAILITPDTHDDIDGIVHHHHHSATYAVVALLATQFLLVADSSSAFVPRIGDGYSTPPGLFHLACVHLC